MGTTVTTYDAFQHSTAVRQPQDKSVAMDCPYTGKGEEFSPTNLVEAALAGCMLMSMGTLAMRHEELDISGARIEVAISTTDKPIVRYDAIDITVTIPRDFPPRDRVGLQRAADLCPIKNSFAKDIPITVHFEYPDSQAQAREASA